MAQKAPGKYYGKGISNIELIELFPDDVAAERWLETTRWGDKLQHLSLSTLPQFANQGSSAPSTHALLVFKQSPAFQCKNWQRDGALAYQLPKMGDCFFVGYFAQGCIRHETAS